MTNASIGPDLLDAARGLQDDTIELRRAIHAEPEIGLQLPMTQKKIVDAITGLGLDITLGESTTSVVADLDSGKPGPTVLLRGDMDALPLQEDAEIDFASTIDGAMHACGHDTHVAMLVSAARLLADNTDEFSGKVRFMFQPGEEGYHGARYMIEEGVLNGVDRAFAIHVTSSFANGMVATRRGPLLASADRFEIDVNGGGGHASAPHNCIDPIPAAAAMVGGFQTILTRDLDPNQSAVVTVAHIESGTTNNIIPASAFMEGTIRTFDEEVRSTVHDGIHRVSTSIAAAHRCSCNTNIIEGYPVTVNDSEQAELTAATTQQLLGAEGFEWFENPLFAAEDFSYVLNAVPGAMAMLGACPDDTNPVDAEPNHSNLVRFNESALYNGVGLYAAMAMTQ